MLTQEPPVKGITEPLVELASWPPHAIFHPPRTSAEADGTFLPFCLPASR